MMGRHRYTLLVTMVVWAGLLAGVAGQDPAVEAAQLGGMKLSELSSWLSARSEVAEADISNCLDADNPKQAALVLARSTLLVAAAGPGDGGRVKEDRVTDELPCTIERRIACKKKKKKNKNKTEQGENMEGKCLGPREFERRFHQKAPVIISGLADGWPARKLWRSEAAFLGRHGEMVAGLKHAGETLFGGPSSISAALPMRQAAPLMAADPSLFVFDQLLPQDSALLQDFTPPTWPGLRATGPPEAKAVDGSGKAVAGPVTPFHGWHMLSVGGNSSGLPWHLHGESWIVVLAGLKRWFVFPPGALPDDEAIRGHPLLSAVEWLATVYPGGDAKGNGTDTQLRECAQRPGELLYLPALWSHLTVNGHDSSASATNGDDNGDDGGTNDQDLTLAVGAQAVLDFEAIGPALQSSCKDRDPDAQMLAGSMLMQVCYDMPSGGAGGDAAAEIIAECDYFNSSRTSFEMSSWHPFSIRPRLELIKQATMAGDITTATARLRQVEEMVARHSSVLPPGLLGRVWYSLSYKAALIGLHRHAYDMLTAKVLHRDLGGLGGDAASEGELAAGEILPGRRAEQLAAECAAMLAAAGDPAMLPVASEHFRRCAALPPYTRGHEAAAAQLAFCTAGAADPARWARTPPAEAGGLAGARDRVSILRFPSKNLE